MSIVRYSCSYFNFKSIYYFRKTLILYKISQKNISKIFESLKMGIFCDIYSCTYILVKPLMQIKVHFENAILR